MAAQILLDNPSRGSTTLLGKCVPSTVSSQLLVGTTEGDGSGDAPFNAGRRLKQWALDINTMFAQLMGTATGFSVSDTPGAGPTNDYDPSGLVLPGTKRLILTPSANATFNGLLSTGVTDDYSLFIYNASSTYSLIFNHLGGGAAANQFSNVSGGTETIPPLGGAIIRYVVGSINKWVFVSVSAAGGGGGGGGADLGPFASLAALQAAYPAASEPAGTTAYAPDSGKVVGDATAYNAIVTGVAQSGGIEGAPAIIRGSVYGARWPAVVAGASVGGTQQAANLTAINAAIAYAASNNLWFVMEPATYEIIGGGLLIPYNDFYWIGSRRTTIVQYSNNQPVIHIGQVLTSGNSTSAVSLSGANLRYSGTGAAGANALELTSVTMSDFHNLDIGDVYQSGSGAVSLPFNGIYFDQSGSSVPCFSNFFENIRIKPWVQWAILATRDDTDTSTGNVFKNIYTATGGSGDIRYVSGGSLYFKNHKQLSIEQWNFEWTKAPCAAHFEQIVAGTVSQVNLEGLQLNPATSKAAFFYELVGVIMKFDGAEIITPTLTAANNVLSAAVFGCDNADYLTIDNYEVQGLTNDSSHSPKFSLVQNFNASGNTTPAIDLGMIHCTGSAPYLDAIDSFAFSGSNAGPVFTCLRELNNSAVQTLADANATIYGAVQCGIMTMAPTVARTLTLSPQLGGSTFPTLPRGVHRRVICKDGSAGTIAVVNGGVGAGTLATLSAGQIGEFVFDSVNWNLVFLS